MAVLFLRKGCSVGKGPGRWGREGSRGLGARSSSAQKHSQASEARASSGLCSRAEIDGRAGVLCQPDLAKYVRKTFLTRNVLMKELTASWSKGGSFSVSAEVRNCYWEAGPGHVDPSKSGLYNLNNDSVTIKTRVQAICRFAGVYLFNSHNNPLR